MQVRAGYIEAAKVKEVNGVSVSSIRGLSVDISTSRKLEADI